MSVDSDGARPGVGSVVLGRYRLDEQVAVGGMGVLWRATDTVLHSVAALKRVSFAHLPEERARVIRDRTEREARLAGRLRGHPHVVSIYDIHVDDTGVWLVQEYLPSRSLSQILSDHGPLHPSAVARIGADIADALAAAHDAHIRHRDVTPGNVLIGLDGRVKLTDFGIARSATDPNVTQTGAVIGTVSYLAPEVARGDDATIESDMFSLGATLYAALEGQPPFGNSDSAVKMLNIVSTGIIRPPENAGPLHPILLRLLELNPGTRPDAATVRESLRRVSDQRSGEQALKALSNGAPSTGTPQAGSNPGSGELRDRLPESFSGGGPAAHPLPSGFRPDLHSDPWRERSPVARSGSEWARTAQSGRLGARRGRAVLAVCLVAAVAVVAGVALLGTGEERTPGPAPGFATGSGRTAAPVARLPVRVPPITMGEDLRALDPCALLTGPALSRLGTVRVHRGTALFGCTAEVTGADGSVTDVGYEMGEPRATDLDHSEDGRRTDLGGLQVYRTEQLSTGEGAQCRSLIVLSDHGSFYGTAMRRIQHTAAPGPCEVAEAADTDAVTTMNRLGGVPRVTSAGTYPLTARNACALVDGRTLGRIKGLRADPYPDFAGWGCKWGEDPFSDGVLPALVMQFQLRAPDEFRKPVDQQRIPLNGATAYQTSQAVEEEPNTCTLYLPEAARPDRAGNYEVIQIKVRAAQDRRTRCGYAKTVAAAVQQHLR